jgi:MFS family permease
VVDSPRAWLTVVATFFSSFVSLGIAYSFGAFFGAMADEFDSTRGATAVIFGITTFLFFWLSLVTGRASDVWGPRPVLAVGAGCLLLGLLATSRVGSLGLGYVTYGAGVGIAAACGYIPMVATVGGWFQRHRATAVGLAVAGIGAGTLVISPVSAALIERYGWRDTYVVLGIAGAAMMLLCVPLIDRPPGHPGRQPSQFGRALRSPVFRRLHLSALCSGLALFVPFVFVGQYAQDRGVGSVPAAVLVGVLGGASILARIGFGGLVRRFGSFTLYRLCFALIASSFLIWLVAGSSYAAMVAFVLVLGAGYGGFVALSTIVLAERMGVVGLGSILGLFYTSQGLGGLIGPASAGWLIDRTGSYRAAIVAAAVLAGAARLLLMGLPVRAGSLEPEPEATAVVSRARRSGGVRRRGLGRRTASAAVRRDT